MWHVRCILLPFFPDVFTKKELFIQSYVINPNLHGWSFICPMKEKEVWSIFEKPIISESMSRGRMVILKFNDKVK